MGGRLLRQWVLSPLRTVETILARQQGVSELVDAPFLREDVRELLSNVRDIERLVARLSTGRGNARGLVALASSLEPVRPLREKLDGTLSRTLNGLREELDPLDDVVRSIRSTLVDAPPPASPWSAPKRRRRPGRGATLRFCCNFDHMRRLRPGGPVASAGRVGPILHHRGRC